MKYKKLLATLVVIAMLASTLVVINKLTDFKIVGDAGASTAGNSGWEGNGSIAATAGDVINTSSSDLYYGNTLNIEINNSASWAATTYYLWYPVYRGNEDTPSSYNLTWMKYVGTGTGIIPKAEPASGDTTFGGGSERTVTLNATGLWVIGPEGTSPNFRTNEYKNSTVPAWFWVNTSMEYTVTPSDTAFEYGDTSTLDVSVYKSGALTTDGAMVAIYNATGKLVYNWDMNQFVTNGVYSGILRNYSFTNAGLWNVEAYYDDPAEFGGKTNYAEGAYGYRYYNITNYGTTSTNIETYATTYNFTVGGPWDPPAYNATRAYIDVDAGKPNIVLKNASTTNYVYWGFGIRIDVNVTDGSGNGITGGNVTIRKSGNTTYWHDQSFAQLYINETGNGNYSIEIPRYNSVQGGNWTNLANGSWAVYFAKDINKDGVEEWNTSGVPASKFTISSSSPPVRLNIISDGDAATGTTTDSKVNIPAFTSGTNKVTPVSIQFQILGTSVADDEGRAYYGDNAWEDRHNITVSGDILYPVNDTTLTYASATNMWTAQVIPNKPGGTITISVDWPGASNGTAAADPPISIVNGSIVTVDVSSFKYGDEFDLTVKVTDMFGNNQYAANVYLYWHAKNIRINQTVPGTGGAGKGENGEYTYKILLSDVQGKSNGAPDNITIAASAAGFSPTHWGYASVYMEKQDNLVINMTPTTAYAGDSTLYNVETLADGAKPSTYSDITYDLYDSNNNLVADAWWTDAQANFNGEYQITDEEIIFPPGTFTLYAKNTTHDSAGYNATIIVTPYHVDAIPSKLAWLIDTETNVTFTLTPSETNGTLKINNITSTPNGSYVTQSHTIDIADGQGTLAEFNATNIGNLTFAYTPDGGAERDADGILKITTATAIADPRTIYIGEAVNVVITVTHPGTGLAVEGVRVDIDYGKNESDSVLTQIPEYQTTDSLGQVTFGVQADGSGNATIYLKRGTDPDNPFVIKAAARKTMEISTDTPTVDETNDTFTVYAKDTAGNLITGVTVTIAFNAKLYTTITGSYEILDIPSVSANIPYTITISAEGYTGDSTTILVIDVPQIYFTAPSGPVNKGEAFTIKVGAENSNGNGIVVTLTKTGKTYTAISVDSIAEFTVDETGTYTISATMHGYAPATEKTIEVKEKATPGFELLTLIIAIGVAFILLRHRRKN